VKQGDLFSKELRELMEREDYSVFVMGVLEWIICEETYKTMEGEEYLLIIEF
jgi:hypothetical protein